MQTVVNSEKAQLHFKQINRFVCINRGKLDGYLFYSSHMNASQHIMTKMIN